MESSILQLSDIHLNGDPKGMFDVQGNLDAVLADAGNRGLHYDLIVLTGDLVDDATVDDYTNLLEGLQRAFGTDLPKELQPAILVCAWEKEDEDHIDFREQLADTLLH